MKLKDLINQAELNLAIGRGIQQTTYGEDILNDLVYMARHDANPFEVINSDKYAVYEHTCKAPLVTYQQRQKQDALIRRQAYSGIFSPTEYVTTDHNIKGRPRYLTEELMRIPVPVKVYKIEPVAQVKKDIVVNDTVSYLFTAEFIFMNKAKAHFIWNAFDVVVTHIDATYSITYTLDGVVHTKDYTDAALFNSDLAQIKRVSGF